MKFKIGIRQSVSQVFDVLIPQGKWQEYIEMLDRDGHPNRRELIALVLIFSKHIEALEAAVENLDSKISLLEDKTPLKSVETDDAVLSTPTDVAND